MDVIVLCLKFWQSSPFPLFPGEELEGKPTSIKKLPVIQENQAIHLMATMEYEDDDGEVHQPGEQWQIKGPLTYIPVPEVVSSGVFWLYV